MMKKASACPRSSDLYGNPNHAACDDDDKDDSDDVDVDVDVVLFSRC